MSDFIKIDVQNEEKLIEAINKFPREASRYLNQAGHEAASRHVLTTIGLQKYPAETDANRPPTPYYIRGRGTQYKNSNSGKSENLGKRWSVKKYQRYGVVIANNASYAQYVHGENQARVMEAIGWRKLSDVVVEKLELIKGVYQAWVDKLLRDLGL